MIEVLALSSHSSDRSRVLRVVMHFIPPIYSFFAFRKGDRRCQTNP
jgi:hypothetical protein